MKKNYKDALSEVVAINDSVASVIGTNKGYYYDLCLIKAAQSLKSKLISDYDLQRSELEKLTDRLNRLIGEADTRVFNALYPNTMGVRV